jgi:hypothetical protein
VTATLILDAASEGLHVIIGMLIVGCIFLAVIGLGEWSDWAAHRRQARKRARRQYY